MAEKKILTLSIKQKFFDEIIAGTKKHEYRDVRPTNAKKYVYLLHDGKKYAPSGEDLPDDDKPVEIKAVHYDAIKLLTGAYTGKRPWALVELLDAEPVILTDENGQDITYEYNGEEYLAVQMDYTLGKVLERSDY